MEIDDGAPLSGTASTGARSERFDGWLGMLRALSDLLGPNAGDPDVGAAGDRTGDAHDTRGSLP